MPPAFEAKEETSVKTQIAGLMLLLFSLSLSAAAQNHAKPVASSSPFQLSSTTFTNNTTLPISMIDNITVNGSNACSVDGSAGGNQSPDLSWGSAPKGTVSFVVTLYDTTAGFTHWGIYNIFPTATGLPANAGVAGSTFGQQTFNDFFDGPQYDGPCPPVGVRPVTHHYVFTVYALDITLQLRTSANFQADAETLYQALIRAGRDGHILRSSSLTGLYSATPD
jgi:Raf kinase inhibitor-like YbhB/YbcL family protein